MSDAPPPPGPPEDKEPPAENDPLMRAALVVVGWFQQPAPSIPLAMLLMAVAVLAQFIMAFVLLAYDAINGEAVGIEVLAHPLALAVMNGGSMLAVLLAALPFARRQIVQAMAFGRARLVSFVPALVAVVGLQIVMSDLTNIMLWLVPPSEEFISFIEGVSGPGHSLAAQFLALVIVAGIGEELIFRGLFLHGFLARHRAWVAIVVSTLMFSLLHMNLWQLPATIGMGLLFGWWRWRTGVIWLCIWGHMINNGLALYFARLAPVDIEGLTDWHVEQGELVLQPWWLLASGFVLLIAAIVWQRFDFKHYDHAR